MDPLLALTAQEQVEGAKGLVVCSHGCHWTLASSSIQSGCFIACVTAMQMAQPQKHSSMVPQAPINLSLTPGRTQAWG